MHFSFLRTMPCTRPLMRWDRSFSRSLSSGAAADGLAKKAASVGRETLATPDKMQQTTTTIASLGNSANEVLYTESILEVSSHMEQAKYLSQLEFIVHGICITSVGLAGLVANVVCLLVLRQPALKCGRQVSDIHFFAHLGNFSRKFSFLLVSFQLHSTLVCLFPAL